MYVSRFRIFNYKSFRDSGEVRLQPGFNVIVGPNNVGKTALLEALSLRFADRPHRSLATVPTSDSQPDAKSRVQVQFETGRREFVEVLQSISPFYVPATGEGLESLARQFTEAISERNKLDSTFEERSTLTRAVWPALKVEPSEEHNAQLYYDPLTEVFKIGENRYFGRVPGSDFAGQLAKRLQGRIYHFKAERLNISEAPAEFAQVLEPNASNLAQCLHTLQSNRKRFDRLNDLVNQILPDVKQVSAPQNQYGNVRIDVWTVNPQSEREDLAVPLSESGTGISQVLAILYVVLTSEEPNTILIDEPQSFLHPGAIRKLIEVLKYYQRHQHQYVVTTHSPTVVTAANAQALVLVRKDGEESIVEEINVSETNEQARFLREVGASLSDVFGADNILWVEGPTEEACFPLILSKVAKRPLLGTKIIGVVHTGDFESKHSGTILEIYRRLSEGRGLLPPAVGFIFDREDRDEPARKELEHLSDSKVVFTGRRMYENYLLNVSAIVAVASDIEGFCEGANIEAEVVSRWLEKHRWDDKYFDKKVEEDSQTEEVWLSDVHGGKLLHEMFQDLSETRVTYDKVVHGTALTQWLCDNHPEYLQDLARLIEDRLPRLVP